MDKFYHKVDGNAMHSHLALTLPKLLMCYHEHMWLENFEGQKTAFYKIFLRFLKIATKLQYSMRTLTDRGRPLKWQGLNYSIFFFMYTNSSRNNERVELILPPNNADLPT